MIAASRFLAQHTEIDKWRAAREGRVTATTVAKAATPAGFKAALGTPSDYSNEFYQYGSEAEPSIMEHAHRQYGILPSGWVITAENNELHAATPDGLSVDHTEIAEAKTTGTDWRTIPAVYIRQVQWQLHVTGADRCLFLWSLRLPDDLGWFYTPWLEPKTVWIDRDPDMIDTLVEVADRLLEAGYGRT